MKRYGIPHHRLKLEECAEFEPTLTRATAKIADDLHLPADVTDDCHLSTEDLYKLCLEEGIQFRSNRTIYHVEHNGQHINMIETETERFEVDAFACALDCLNRIVLT